MSDASNDFMSKVDAFLAKREKLILFFILLISTAFALFLFDTKLSDGHDDSLYIMSGYKYYKDFFGYFHVANAPFYTMFLALPIAIFGINLIILKLISVLCFILFLFFFFKALRQRIPYIILFSVMLTVGINSRFLFYSHQTFTESFFLFLQSLFFFFLFKHLDKENLTSIKDSWQGWILVGFMLFILAITKSVSIVAVSAVSLYFLIQKNFKAIAFMAVPFVFFFGIFSILKRFIWEVPSQFASQGGKMFLKNYYDKSQGTEDFPGMLQRYFDNFDIYISKHLFTILGFREFNSESNLIWGIIAITLFGLGLFWAIKKKNKYVQLLLFYTLALTTATFFALQAHWGQERLILVYIPFLLVGFYYGLYMLSKGKLAQITQPILLIILIIIPYVSLKATWKNAPNNTTKLRKNLRGDVLYGLTPDWINYIKMSEWIGKNLSDSDYVACRKPPKSFIYSGGKDFYGIYRVPSQDADTLLSMLRQRNVTHVMMASLRIDPSKNTGQTITTVRRYLSIIQQKYPNALTQVHVIGQQEQTYLFKINYP